MRLQLLVSVRWSHHEDGACLRRCMIATSSCCAADWDAFIRTFARMVVVVVVVGPGGGAVRQAHPAPLLAATLAAPAPRHTHKQGLAGTGHAQASAAAGVAGLRPTAAASGGGS